MPEKEPFSSLDLIDNSGTLVPITSGNPTSRKNKVDPITDFVMSSPTPKFDVNTQKVSLSDVQSELNPRFDTVTYGYNNEDAYAQQQGILNKAFNGVAKGVVLAATTFAGGISDIVYGIPSAIANGDITKIWNNDVTKFLQEINTKVDQEYLPNYYTDQEKNAAWYSPDNLFPANFLFDKLIKNAGFAVGAIYSGNVAGKVIGAAGATLGNVFTSLADYGQAYKSFSSLSRGAARLFSQGKNIEAAEAMRKSISTLPELEETKTALLSIAKQQNAFTGANDFVNRAIRGLYSSAGESGFEAMGTSTAFREKLINDYKNKWGVDEVPQEEMSKIDKAANDVGNASFLANMAVLSVTEYMQMPYLMGSSYKTSKAAANTFRNTDRMVLDEATGRMVVAEAATKLGRTFNNTKNFVGTYVFDPKEMLQEYLQNSVDVGVQSYFNKKYQGQEVDGWIEAFSSVTDTFGTKQAMESALLGGLSGGIMQAKNKYKERSTKNINNANFINELGTDNTFANALKERKEGAQRHVALENEATLLAEAGDKKGWLDNKFDQIHNYIAPRIKYGRTDMIKEDLQEKMELASTKEGYEKLQASGEAPLGLTQADFLQKLSEISKQVDSTIAIHEATYLALGGQYNQDGSRKYEDAVIDKLIYAASKITDYDKRIPQVSRELASKGVPVAGIVEQALGLGQEGVDEKAAALKYIDSISAISAEKEELRQQVEDVIALSKNRKSFIDEYDKIKATPEAYKEATVTPTAAVQPSTIAIKTKSGDENIEIGTEYFLGKVVEYDKNGKEVHRFPRLTILGENADGTIKIKDGNGQIRDVSKSVLEDYKLGKVSDTLNNKKAKFFMENVNTIFEFNFGKGKKVKGRLEYSSKDKVLHFVYKDGKGKIKSMEVTGDQFVAKKGFITPMITAVGQLTAASQKSLEDFASEKDTREAAKRGNRMQIITELFDDTSAKIESSKKLLQEKYTQLEKVIDGLSAQEQKIKAGELTKRNNFKATTNRAIKAANLLSRMQEQLVQEIKELETEQEQLEFAEAYIADMAQNIDEFPTNTKDFLEELNDQVLDLQILQQETGKQINALSKIIDNVEKALQSAVDFIVDLISSFSKKYPKVPTEYGQEWVDFLKANPNFLKLQPNFKEDLKTVDELVGQVDDLDVKPNERTAKELRGELETLQTSLQSIEKELAVKETILAKFNEAITEFKKEEAKKKEFLADKAVRETYFKQQQANEQKSGEPTEEHTTQELGSVKDISFALATSSAPPWVDSRDGSIPETKDDNFHRRHQTFLFNQSSSNPKLFSQEVYNGKKAKDRLKIIPITSVSADALGFPTDWIPEQYKFNGSNADTAGIYYVYVIEEGNKLFYVDVNGNKLSEVKPSTEALDTTKLIYSNAETAKPNNDFTNKDKLNEKDLLAAWLDIRKQFLKITAENVWRYPRDFKVSRGFPSKTKGTTRQTNVLEAQLVTEDDLKTNVVIQVPTASSKFPAGIPLLNFNGNTLFLNNRNFTREEAENIYDVLVYAASSKEGLTNEIFTYLRNVLYFSTSAKDQIKRNQIFLKKGEEDMPVLVIGENQIEIPFIGLSTEDGNDLINKKEELIRVIENMYHHVNNHSLLELKNKPNTPFQEIGVKDGQLYTKKEHPSYQHYLLLGPTAPLTANINIPQEGETPIKEKYSILSFTELDPSKFKPAPPAAPTAPAAPKQEIITREAKGMTITASVTRGPSGTVEKVSITSMVANKDIPAEDGSTAFNEGENVTAHFKESLPSIEEAMRDGLNTEAPKAATTATTIATEKITKKANGHTFVFNVTKNAKGEAINVLLSSMVDDSDSTEIIDVLPPETKAGIENSFLSGFNSQLAKEQPATEEPAPVVTYQVDKKADIERRREEALDKIKNNREKGYKQIEAAKFDKEKEEALKKPKDETYERESKEINAKYDAELAALETPSNDLDNAVDYQEDAENRIVFDQWNKYEGNKEQETEDISFMLPNVKIKMVGQLIKTSGGGQAWGAARSAMMEIYKDAPFGTKYHESFEQIFNWVLTPEEQIELYEEFKTRKGTFTTFSGETKKFSDAGFKEAKEQMAEEFIEYKQTNASPKKSNKISQFFKDLWNLIKEFLNTKPATLASVFDKLNRGAYRMVPMRTAKGVEYRERNVKGEAVSFVNTVLSGMTADIFIEKWKNDVNLIMDLEERPEYAERELFNNLLSRLTDYYENNKNQAGVSAYYGTLLRKATTPEEKADVRAKHDAIQHAWKRVKNQWTAYTEDLKTFLKVFDVSFQVDDEGNIDVVPELDSTEEKTQLQYVDDKMSINAKNSASKAIKLLMATVSDSQFKKVVQSSLETRGNNLTQIVPIRDDVMRMRMLAPYAKLFNYILYNTANIPGIYNIVDKLSTMSDNTNLKQNANVKSLLNRLGYDSEKGFEGLSIHQIKLLLKLENALSKNKPTFVRQELTEDGKTVFKFSNIYDRVSQLTEQWGNGLKALKFTTVSGDNIQFDKSILAADPYVFLSHLNIPISKNSFPIAKEKELLEQVDVIKNIVAKYVENPLPIISKGKSTGIDTRLKNLAKFYVENIEGESTESQHLNMAGKVTANFVLPNFLSHILSDANIAGTLEEFIELNPQYKDLYMGSSYFLNNIMYKDGQRNKSLHVAVVEGKNIYNDGRATDKMNEGERMLYEINNNLNGYYYTLVPADTKLEYAINSGNIVAESFFKSQGKVKAVSEYVDVMYASLQNEMALMNDYDNRKNISALNRVQNGTAIGKQLRFFKYILSSANVAKVEKGTLISKEEFASDLLSFIDKQAKENIKDLKGWQLISDQNELYGMDSTFMQKNFNQQGRTQRLSDAALLELFQWREMNYVFNNIEMHKLFFNDPAQWKDELKATKSFVSGREATHVDTVNDSRGLNEALKNTLNKGLQPTDIGWTNFKNHLNAVTIRDILTVSSEFEKLKKALEKKSKKYGEMDIADGQSWAHGSAYREILYKSGGRFTAQQEELHQWLMAWERRDKNKYSSEALKTSDALILSKPIPSSDKHIMYILKPIVSGTKLLNGSAVQYLYKTSTAPLYAYFVKGTPLEGVHNKMTEKGIDFLAMQSVNKRTGQLVDNTISMFDANGQVSPEFNTVVSTPIDYKYFGIQVDTASQKEKQTQGSQLTKLAVVDLMSGGVPIDFINKNSKLSKEKIQEKWDSIVDKSAESNVYKLVQNHKDVLIALAIKRGEKVFNQLGIQKGEFGYTYRDKAIVANFILKELDRRELPENIKEGISLTYNADTDTKEFVNPLEANVNYQKIKQILWSVIEKGVTRPKMPGGPKVQMSVAGLGNIKEVTINGKKAYVDDTLKYYGVDADGNTTPCEIDLPYFFGDKLRESLKQKGKTFATDEEFFTHILDYLNNTPEGQSLLKGIGFRIPTQKPNSLEYFKVRKFLAPQLGDVVVLPAEITTKAGSDFDVDKLNTYLKKWYIGKSGYPKVVKLQDIDATNTQQLTDIYEYTLKNKRKEWEDQQPINALFNDLFPISGEEQEYVPSLEEFIAEAKGKSSLELNSLDALENHYIETLEQLMALPENYKAILSPNDASQLDNLSQKIQKLTNNIDVDINPGHLISSNFMAKKRNTLLASKSSVGISAVSATNVAINQASDITIAIPTKFRFKNIAIRFPHNTINGQASLSGVYTTSGDNISDINSQMTDGAVDVAKKEWLPRLGFTDTTISTALLMNTWGTPVEHIAMFINQPAVQAYLKAKEINRVITKYTGKKNKPDWEIQDDVNKQFINKSIFEVRKTKPDQYKLSEMEDMLTKPSLSDKDNVLQIQMLDDFIAYQAMAGERLSVVQGYNYDTARITSPEDMYKKELDEEKAQNSSVNSIDKLTTNTYVGKIAEIAKEINTALKSLINTQTGLAGNTIKLIAYDLKKHFGIGNSSDTYTKYMNKAESAMIDYIIQTKSTINSLPLNTNIKALLSSAASSARYIQKLKQDVANNPNHPLANNKLLSNFVTDIDVTNKKPSTVTIAEPDFDTFTSDSYTDQFRELLSSAATVELQGVKNSNRLVSQVFQNLIVAHILQNGSSRKQGSFFHLIPNEIYTEYAAPVLRNIEANLDYFYDSGLFYRNNYRDNKLVPLLRPDYLNEMDELEFASRTVLGKKILLVNSDKYYSFPFTKIVDRATKIAKLYKRIDSEDQQGRKSPATIMAAKDSDPLSSIVRKVAYQEVNILGDGNKAQEYYEDKLHSLYNPKIEETSDAALIREMENIGMKISYENIPLLNEENDLPSLDAVQEEFIIAKSITENKIVEGDIWTSGGIPIITTNLGGVHGAGLANQAFKKGFIKYKQEGNFGDRGKVITFPVKIVWSDKTDLPLLKDSANKLIKLANDNPTKTYSLPLIGLGHGEGKLEDILPVIKSILNSTTNVQLVLPTETTDRGKQGTARTDNSLSIVEQVKKELSSTKKEPAIKAKSFEEFKEQLKRKDCGKS